MVSGSSSDEVVYVGTKATHLFPLADKFSQHSPCKKKKNSHSEIIPTVK